jgi:octanoyl-[GcvH]:protein N-octanoyltransferase
VRIHRPEPTVAFGRLDRLSPGYAEALQAAQRHGFAVLEREPGGHAAAYHEHSLVLEITGEGGLEQVHQRFERAAATLAAALQSIGVDARLGPVPGEWCPGEYSVNLGGTAKLAGLAQRVRGRTYTLGASLIVENPEPVRAVLTDVYARLGLPFDPRTVAVPGPPIDVVENALRVVDTWT